ncbi:MAG: 1,6-anhydro-N-acetylmuramyl-L-alanine amidase AmpD [Gammaproteobacteria bacterium]|nr:MAG: 1,6-anhydro-N-acetylmuramyl-L-alanine amidase AmpD [Gammaproteobacteria bacterium]
MHIQITNGWLTETATISRCPSPNADQRPCDTAVSLLVIHHISLPPHEFGGDAIEAFFTNHLDTQKHPFYQEIADLRVSAHVLIKRNGAMVQFVNFNERAWHAGKSDYHGRTNCNDFSIGIELEGDEIAAYRYAQYKVLTALTRALQVQYPEIQQHITGHEHIAPGRKTDPGPTFDWARYQQSLHDPENPC